jgi:hypothetical protein
VRCARGRGRGASGGVVGCCLYFAASCQPGGSCRWGATAQGSARKHPPQPWGSRSCRRLGKAGAGGRWLRTAADTGIGARTRCSRRPRGWSHAPPGSTGTRPEPGSGSGSAWLRHPGETRFFEMLTSSPVPVGGKGGALRRALIPARSYLTQGGGCQVAHSRATEDARPPSS